MASDSQASEVLRGLGNWYLLRPRRHQRLDPAVADYTENLSADLDLVRCCPMLSLARGRLPALGSPRATSSRSCSSAPPFRSASTRTTSRRRPASLFKSFAEEFDRRSRAALHPAGGAAGGARLRGAARRRDRGAVPACPGDAGPQPAGAALAPAALGCAAPGCPPAPSSSCRPDRAQHDPAVARPVRRPQPAPG